MKYKVIVTQDSFVLISEPNDLKVGIIEAENEVEIDEVTYKKIKRNRKNFEFDKKSNMIKEKKKDG